MRAQRASSPRAAREWRRRRHSCWAGCHNHAVPSKAVHGMSQLIGARARGWGCFFQHLQLSHLPRNAKIGPSSAPWAPATGLVPSCELHRCHSVARSRAAGTAAVTARCPRSSLPLPPPPLRRLTPPPPPPRRARARLGRLLSLLAAAAAAAAASAARHSGPPPFAAPAAGRIAPARSASDRSACERGGARAGSGTHEGVRAHPA